MTGEQREYYGAGLPVWEFDIYFAESRRFYDTDWVRARDNRQAKRAIKRNYPYAVEYDFDETYAP
jgi:hypothetical protein